MGQEVDLGELGRGIIDVVIHEPWSSDANLGDGTTVSPLNETS